MKVGDKVRVVKKINVPSWVENMDKCIGVTYDIVGFSETDKDVCLENGWWFPVESLELVADSNTVAAPTHYTTGNIECIDAIRSALTEEEFRGYCKGNVLKYTWREKLKGGDEDLKKAKQYIEFMGVK